MHKVWGFARITGIVAVAFVLGSCANMGSPIKPQANAAQVLQSVGTFKSFLTAAETAGMMPTLTGQGPIAVFAPTDAAFARLPKGSFQALLLPRNRTKLKALVANHILAGQLTTANFLNGVRTVQTMAGRVVEVSGLNPDKGLFFGEARIVKPDIEATNGTIHAIDRIVLP